MRNLTSLADHTLNVVRPEFLKFNYEIRFGDEKVGSLSYPKALSRKCELLCAEGHWSIEPAGALKSDFLVKTLPAGEQFAIYHPKVWSGKNELRFPDGRTYFIKSNAWRTRTCAYTSEEREMLRVETQGVFHPQISMTMLRTTSRLPYFSLLGLMTLYAHVSPSKESS